MIQPPTVANRKRELTCHRIWGKMMMLRQTTIGSEVGDFKFSTKIVLIVTYRTQEVTPIKLVFFGKPLHRRYPTATFSQLCQAAASHTLWGRYAMPHVCIDDV